MSRYCSQCLVLREDEYLVKRPVRFYTGIRNLVFCSDKKCADSYFASHPQRSHSRRRMA